MKTLTEVLSDHPELTATGFRPLDYPAYAKDRQKLVQSELAYSLSLDWLMEHGVPPWVDHSMQLKHQLICNHYIPQGAAIAAVIALGLPYQRTEGDRILVNPKKFLRSQKRKGA